MTARNDPKLIKSLTKVGKEDRQSLIAELYSIVLNPKQYDAFMDLWEARVEERVGELKLLENETLGQADFEDPEIEDHFRRAYEILEHMGRKESERETIKKLIQNESGIAIVFDRKTAVLEMNEPAIDAFGRINRIADLEPVVDPGSIVAVL